MTRAASCYTETRELGKGASKLHRPASNHERASCNQGAGQLGHRPAAFKGAGQLGRSRYDSLSSSSSAAL